MYPGVWRQGDWVRFSEAGTCIITGRSDATLNRGGVRMGTSELYAVIEEFAEVDDSLVVHLEDDEGGPGELRAVRRRRPRRRPARAARGRAAHAALAAARAGYDRRRPGDPAHADRKKLEAPVKRILRGAAAEAVASRGALAGSSALLMLLWSSVRGEEEMTVVQPALAPPRIVSEDAPDGSRILRSEMPLEPYEASLGVLLRRWADGGAGPGLPGRARRGRRLGQPDLGRGEPQGQRRSPRRCWTAGSGPQRPLLLLSGNAIDHALLTLGGFLAGVPSSRSRRRTR